MDRAVVSAARNAALSASEVAERHEDEGVRYLARAVEELAEVVEKLGQRA